MRGEETEEERGEPFLFEEVDTCAGYHHADAMLASCKVDDKTFLVSQLAHQKRKHAK